MATLRSFQVAYIISGILVVLGVIALIPPSPESLTKTATIPSGNYYYYISIPISKEGNISGTFSLTGNSTVNVYVFNQGQYDAFRTQAGVPASMFSTTGSSGSYSASISFPGTYYLVATHSSSSQLTDQTVSFNFTLTGFNLVFPAIGAALVAVAVVLWVVGSRARKKFLKSRAPPGPSDVTLFPQPSSPPPQ